MNVLLLSDFSDVAINATHYAMDLLQKEKVNFILANIFVPDPLASSEDLEKKRLVTKSRLEERVEKLRERSKERDHQVQGFYSEDKLVNAARIYLEKHKVDLIVIGAVGKKFRHLTILGNHTFEIISKIKCNILAVPEECNFQQLQKMLLPLDYSVSPKYGNIKLLNEAKFFSNAELNVLDVSDRGENDKNGLKKEIFYKLKNLQVNFSNLDDALVLNESRWKDVQRKFDIIVLLAKNLRISDKLLHHEHGLYNSVPNRLPILVLHD